MQEKYLDEDHFGLEKVKDRITRISCSTKKEGKTKGAYFMFSWASRCWKNFLR